MRQQSLDSHLVSKSVCVYTRTVSFFLAFTVICVNAVLCPFVLGLKHHLLRRASAPVGLSHRLKDSCQTSEEIMVMFLPDPIWWPAELTPSAWS